MRILIVVGTRPEAIKMLPLARELKQYAEFEVVVCNSGQHGELVEPIMRYFNVKADLSFEASARASDLSSLSERLMSSFAHLFKNERFDLVLTHGDTTTAFCASLEAFYCGIRVAHIESGLRTYNMLSPFPEEFNRVAVDALSYIHFAPTAESARNLKREGRENIYVVGNTVIDALGYTLTEDYRSDIIDKAAGRKILLVTAHRRESIGDKMDNIFGAVGDILKERDDFFGVIPMHPNPQVRERAFCALSNVKNAELCEPFLPYDFHNILLRSFATLTDSGGIQEEASYLGVPVFLLRETTERREGVRTGNIRVLGTDREKIKHAFLSTVDDVSAYSEMRKVSFAFGKCGSCNKIAEILLSFARKDVIMKQI